MSSPREPLANRFWVRAALTSFGLAALLAIAGMAARLYSMPRGRFAATLISVGRSREILDNPGVTGYYERLLARTGTMDKIYTFDRSFRVFRFKPNLTWEHDLVTTNGYGMVGPECSMAKPAGVRRVALLGGSLTSGHMIHADQTYGALLERRLNEDRPAGPGVKFEVLNFACVAYTLTQTLDVAAEDAPRFHPDVYLVDVNELAVYRQWDRHLVQLIQQRIDPKYAFLRTAVRESGASPEDDPLVLHGELAPYRIPVLRDTLAELKQTVGRDHASLIVVLLPSVEAGDLSKRRVDGFQSVLASLNITVVDLMDTFDGILDTSRLAAYRGDVHPNAEGHEMIFRNLYAKLQARPDVWKTLIGTGAEGR